MSQIDAILLTHEHKDHSSAAGILSRRFNIPIYANEKTHMEISKFIGKVSEKNIRFLKTNSLNEVLGVDIETIGLKHDCKEAIGFAFYEKNKKLSYITDTGELNSSMMDRIKDSNLYFLEANYDPQMLINGPYSPKLKGRVSGKFGHLSNEETARALLDLLRGDGEKVYLGHVSKINNSEDHSYETVKAILEGEGLKIDDTLSLKVASRYYRGELVEV